MEDSKILLICLIRELELPLYLGGGVNSYWFKSKILCKYDFRKVHTSVEIFQLS